MTDQQLYCDGPGRDPGTECHLPVAGHGKGKCQAHLKQMQRVGKLSPIAEKLSAEERSLVAHDAWLKAGDSDEEYEVRRRAALAAAKQLGKKETCEAIRKAMAEARTRGVRLGRPPKVDPAAEPLRHEEFDPLPDEFCPGITKLSRRLRVCHRDSTIFADNDNRIRRGVEQVA